jgi:selenide,water dikinase
MSAEQQSIICDPQTSGGLLVAVDAESEGDFLALINEVGLSLDCIGSLSEENNKSLITIV